MVSDASSGDGRRTDLERDRVPSKLADHAPSRTTADLTHELAQLLAQTIAQRFFAEDPSVPYFQTVRDHIRLRTQWRSRARYLSFAVAPNEEDFELKSVPAFLNFVYYGLRPLRLLGKRSQSTNRTDRATNPLA